MAEFGIAISVILAHEGGYVNNKRDPGGATNFGISLYWLKHLGELTQDAKLEGDINHDGRVDAEDIKALTPDIAADFYRKHWWTRYRYVDIISDRVATKVFDCAVNMGGIQAHKLLQRAIQNCQIKCACDGLFGPATLAAVNAANPVILLPEYRRQCANFYINLVHAKPKFSEFLNGWLRRAAS